MKLLMLAFRTLLAGIGLLLMTSNAGAQSDAWTRGRDLFAGIFTPVGDPPVSTLTKGGCATCHSTTTKAGKSAARIKQAIGDPAIGPGMQIPRLQSLSDDELNDIAAYLSTPKHATLSPTSHAFGDLAVGFLPRPTRTFTLRSDGDSSRGLPADTSVSIGAVSISDTANYAVSALACTSPLAVDSECDIAVVTFQPQSVTPNAVNATLTVGHDGYGGGSTAGASGRGVPNIEILTAAQPFTAPFTTPATTSASQPFTIANRLGSNLRLCLQDSLTFPAPGDFNLVGRTYEATARCTTLTTPGFTPSQSITFAPTADGPRFARFTVTRAGTSDIALVELQGNAGPFGNYDQTELFTATRQDINMGATAPPVSLRLTNKGSANLVVNRSIPRVSSAAVDEYFVSGCANGTVLAQDAFCDMSLTFDPAAIGLRQTNLVVTYGTRTDRIALRGTGFVGPELSVRDSLNNLVATNSTIDFGRQNINVVYPRRLTLTNIGSDEALIVSAASIGPAASGFALAYPTTGGCASLAAAQQQTLVPGASCVVDIRFAPTQTVTYSAALTIRSRPAISATPPPSEHRTSLAGEGANDIPVLVWRDTNGNDVTTIDFPLPATAVGTANPPRTTIRLANQGPGAAALRLLNVIGAGAGNFTVDSTAASSCTFGDQALPLFQGATCDVTIVFSPQTAGTKQAGLQLASTGTTPQPIQITAQASGPAAGGTVVSVLPATIDFDAVRVGARSTAVTVTIASTGSAAATVTGIEADQPFGVQAGTCPAAPFTLAPQSSCTVGLTFAPAADGEAVGSLRVLIQGQATVAAPLSGDGEAPADLSSGGCTVANGESPFDPTLWALGMLAAAALFYRRRLRQRELDVRARR